MGFADLPNEILTMICCYIGIRDLKKVRLVSKAFRNPATERLFSVLILKPQAESIKRWNNVFADAELQSLAKFTVIETFPNLYWCSDYTWYIEGQKDTWEDWTLPYGFYSAIENLSLGFPKVHSTKIKFSRDTIDEHSVEPPARRSMILESILKALSTRSVKSELANVDILKVANMFNCDYGTLTVSQHFQEAMRALKDLHIQIRQDLDPLFSYDADEFSEHKHKMQYFKSRWLVPVSSHLTSLSLYFEFYWGVAPRLQMKGLNFPSLRSLALGNYTFANEWQLDWLTSLSSLETLMLQNCPILFLMTFDEDEMGIFEIDASGWQEVARGNGLAGPVFKNPARWSACFDRIRVELPNLIDFGFGCADWSHGADKVRSYLE